MTAPERQRPAAADPLVELRGVGKRYGRRRWVLRAVAAAVPAGAVVEVRGANGAGKSTLLRLVAGVSFPSAGRRSARAGLRVGYAPDGLEAPPGLTLASYLDHHARIRGLRRPDGRRQVAELAERLGFHALMGDRLPELSKGSLHKAVVAQALIGAPGLVVLDEPFAGLDAAARAALAALLAERAAAGAAVVFSDHGEGAERLPADVVWHVGAGRVSRARHAAVAG